MSYRTVRIWTLGLLGLTALVTAPAALAAGHGHRYDGHQSRHGGYHYDRGRYNRSNYRRYDNRRYQRNRYRSNYRYRSGSNRGAYLVGGVILGSVITHALTRPRVEHHDNGYHETRVIRETRSTQPSRRLFRDRDGNCYERSSDRQGNEVLIDLPPSECAW